MTLKLFGMDFFQIKLGISPGVGYNVYLKRVIFGGTNAQNTGNSAVH